MIVARGDELRGSMRAGAAALQEDSARCRRRSGLNSRTLIDGLVRVGDVVVVGLSGLVASAVRFSGVEDPGVANMAFMLGLLIAANAFACFKLYDVSRFTQLSHQVP